MSIFIALRRRECAADDDSVAQRGELQGSIEPWQLALRSSRRELRGKDACELCELIL
jgi:hypothetical protein